MSERAPETISLEVPLEFGPRNATHWFASLGSVPDASRLELVVGPDARLTPTGIVLLAATFAGRNERRRGNTTIVTQAGSPSHQRLNDATLQFALGHTENPELSSAAAGTLVGPITNLRQAREIADRLGSTLGRVLEDSDTSPVRALRFLIEELAANVVQHSDRPATGFGFAQADRESRQVEVAFADAGVGFLSSLQRHPELQGRLSEDAEALQLALEPRISGGRVGKNMGFGLSLLRDLSDRLDGELWIASGSALLHRRTAVPGQRVNTVEAIAPWRGSWVCLEFRHP